MKSILGIIIALFLGGTLKAQSFEEILGQEPKSDVVYDFLMTHCGFESRETIDTLWHVGYQEQLYFGSQFHIKGEVPLNQVPFTIDCKDGKIDYVVLHSPKLCTEACRTNPKWLKYFEEDLEGGFNMNMTYKDAKKAYGDPIVENKGKKYMCYKYIRKINDQYEVEAKWYPKGNNKTVISLRYRRPQS